MVQNSRESGWEEWLVPETKTDFLTFTKWERERGEGETVPSPVTPQEGESVGASSHFKAFNTEEGSDPSVSFCIEESCHSSILKNQVNAKFIGLHHYFYTGVENAPSLSFKNCINLLWIGQFHNLWKGKVIPITPRFLPASRECAYWPLLPLGVHSFSSSFGYVPW